MKRSIVDLGYPRRTISWPPSATARRRCTSSWASCPGRLQSRTSARAPRHAPKKPTQRGADSRRRGPARALREVLLAGARRRIVGFITRGRGLTVHARDCLTVVKSVLDRSESSTVEWDIEEPASVRCGRRLHRARPSGPPGRDHRRHRVTNGNITKAEVTVTEDRRGINHFVVEVADLSPAARDHARHTRSTRRHQRRTRPEGNSPPAPPDLLFITSPPVSDGPTLPP